MRYRITSASLPEWSANLPKCAVESPQQFYLNTRWIYLQATPKSTHTWSWFPGAPHQTPLVHNQKLAAIARPWPAVHPGIRIILFAFRHWSPQPVVWNGRVWRVHSNGRWPEDSPNFNYVIHGWTCCIESFASKLAAQPTQFNSFHFRIVKHVFELIPVHIQIATCFETCLCIHISMFHGAHIWDGAAAHLHKTSSAAWSYGQYSSMNAYDCIGPIPLCVSLGDIAHSNGMISLPQLKYFQCSEAVRSRSSKIMLIHGGMNTQQSVRTFPWYGALCKVAVFVCACGQWRPCSGDSCSNSSTCQRAKSWNNVWKPTTTKKAPQSCRVQWSGSWSTRW